MDNFHIEMRTTLEDVKTSQPTFKSEIIHQKFNILQEYFPNMFAEALIQTMGFFSIWKRSEQ